MRIHTFHQLPTGAWWEGMNPGYTAQSTTVSLQPHALARDQCPRPDFKLLRLHKALCPTPFDSLVPINIYLGIIPKPFLVFGLITYCSMASWKVIFSAFLRTRQPSLARKIYETQLSVARWQRCQFQGAVGGGDKDENPTCLSQS